MHISYLFDLYVTRYWYFVCEGHLAETAYCFFILTHLPYNSTLILSPHPFPPLPLYLATPGRNHGVCDASSARSASRQITGLKHRTSDPSTGGQRLSPLGSSVRSRLSNAVANPCGASAPPTLHQHPSGKVAALSEQQVRRLQPQPWPIHAPAFPLRGYMRPQQRQWSRGRWYHPRGPSSLTSSSSKLSSFSLSLSSSSRHAAKISRNRGRGWIRVVSSVSVET